MKLSPGRAAFVYVAVPLLLLAPQTQSCAESPNPGSTIDGPGPNGAAAGAPASGGAGFGGAGPEGPNGNSPAGTPASGATGSTAGAGGAPMPATTPPNPKETRVSVVQSAVSSAAAIDQAEVTRLVTDAVAAAGGLQGIVEDGDTVVLKPNLVQSYDFTGPEWSGSPLAQEVNGVTTDWRVTRAVVDLVRELNPSGAVYILEGSASSTPAVYQALGYTSERFPDVTALLAIEQDSGSFGDESSPGLVLAAVPDGKAKLQQHYYMNRKYYEADVVISIPVLKNHWYAVVTGGIKNVGVGATPATLYGNSASDPNRFNAIDHYSIALHHWIHDFYLARPVEFVVVDGLQGVQNGPTPCQAVSGTTDLAQDQMNMRLIMAGRDAVAVDSTAALVMGWDPLTVEYLKALHESGAGTAHTSDIRVVGARVDQVRKRFAGGFDQFSYGGDYVQDVTPPPVTLLSSSVEAGALLLSVKSVPNELYRVEVFLNGAPLDPPISADFEHIALDVRGFPPGPYELEVLGFDFHRNVGVASASITL